MATKKELLAQQVAKAVGAGKAVALETVDFNDPNRPKTCLEVDFPILAVNQVAVIEGKRSRLLIDVVRGAWDRLGFDVVDDEAFFQLVLARLVEPTSKLDS